MVCPHGQEEVDPERTFSDKGGGGGGGKQFFFFFGGIFFGTPPLGNTIGVRPIEKRSSCQAVSH